MKHILLCTCVLMLLVMIGFGADLAQAGGGKLYSIPSWDQTLACQNPGKGCPRFLVLTNMNSEAVLDKETGLVWQKTLSTTTQTWEAAQAYCRNLALGGRMGWRVPTVQELASLLDPTVPSPGPTLPIGHPFDNVQSNFYWTATTTASNTDYAYEVWLEYGLIYIAPKTNGQVYAWCVRGGQGADPQ